MIIPCYNNLNMEVDSRSLFSSLVLKQGHCLELHLQNVYSTVLHSCLQRFITPQCLRETAGEWVRGSMPLLGLNDTTLFFSIFFPFKMELFSPLAEHDRQTKCAHNETVQSTDNETVQSTDVVEMHGLNRSLCLEDQGALTMHQPLSVCNGLCLAMTHLFFKPFWDGCC